jgi:ABC-type spermidine/putrescine transport system permease subunit II
MTETSAVSPEAPRVALQSRLIAVLAVGFVLFVVGYIMVPIVVTAVMSFNDDTIIRFPISTWSLRWYHDFLSSPQWTGALVNSLIVAVGTMVISTAAGVLAAWAFERYHIPMRGFWYIVIMLPLFTPGVVLGLGVAIAFGAITIAGEPIYGSRGLVMLAHSLWAMPLVFMLMEATFRTIDHRVIEASYDLGGRPVRTFFEIVLPMVSIGIISSALFAFVISLNEFVMALFLTTRDSQTLPVLMWLSLRSAGSPRLAVAAVILALAVYACLTVVLLWYVRQVRKTAS